MPFAKRWTAQPRGDARAWQSLYCQDRSIQFIPNICTLWLGLFPWDPFESPSRIFDLHTLDLARCHLECQGIAVVGGFLQPSSDAYVEGKLGPECAMRLDDRITACELAAEEKVREHNCEKWIHAWRSGQTNGFSVPCAVEKFLNAAVASQLGAQLEIPIVAYMVCGADLVQRCGGWHHPPPSPVVVLQRPGIQLPVTKPCEGWEVADGEMKPISSTRIRDAIASEHWNTLIQEGCSSDVVEFMRARHELKTLFMA